MPMNDDQEWAPTTTGMFDTSTIFLLFLRPDPYRAMLES